MPQDKIEITVLEVLKEVQELSGRKWEGLSPGGKPIGSLAGFDSLCSIEATVMIEQKLGGAPLGACSLFVSEDGLNALSLEEISQYIRKLTSALQGKR